MIIEHLSTFAGLPVIDFEGPDEYPEAQDGELAWRVSVDPYEEDEPYDEMFVRFLETVDTEDVRALLIGCWGETSAERPIELLCDAAQWFPALRAVFVGELSSEELEITWIDQADVTPLLETFPGLEILRARGGQGLRLRPVRHERLHHLAFETGGLPASVVRAVCAAELPALEHLELWLGVAEHGADWTPADLEPILAGARWPGLRYLGLTNTVSTDELAARLAAAPVLARLETLDLSEGTLGDAGAEALLAADAVRGLAHLDLRHHFLSEPMTERVRATLAAAGVDVDLSERQDPGRPQPGGEPQEPPGRRTDVRRT